MKYISFDRSRRVLSNDGRDNMKNVTSRFIGSLKSNWYGQMIDISYANSSYNVCHWWNISHLIDLDEFYQMMEEIIWKMLPLDS